MADQYTVEFRAPALPYPPTEYSAAEFEQLNKILRLYFNQLDNVLRDTSLADKADAVGWFVS
jgi:hypothetical protein